MPEMDGAAVDPETGRSRIDQLVATGKLGQIRISTELLKGLLGIHDAGEVVGIAQDEVERLAGTFRVLVYSSRLPKGPEYQPAQFIDLPAVQ